MFKKDFLRKKYYALRKKKYFEVKPSFFNPLLKLTSQIKTKNYINLSSYYPSCFEVNTLKIFESNMEKKITIFLPDVMLVPLLSYDKNKNRLGYGKGFYDRYLKKYLKKYKNILTIGIAFSFQKHHTLPVLNNDVKLNYILTEKGIF